MNSGISSVKHFFEEGKKWLNQIIKKSICRNTDGFMLLYALNYLKERLALNAIYPPVHIPDQHLCSQPEFLLSSTWA